MNSRHLNRFFYPIALEPSDSETVEIAIALDIQRKVAIVVRPFLVLGELDVSHGFGETLMLVGRLFHGSRQILQVGERGARVLLGSDLAAVRAGMARDQPLPVFPVESNRQ